MSTEEQLRMRKERRNQRDRELREYRKKNHICIRCGKNPTTDKSMCDSCREKIATYRNETREFNKKHNICTMCRHEIVYDGFSTCEMCRDKQKEYSAKFYSKETEEDKLARNTKQAEYMKNKREDRKLQGVCIECGKRLCSNSTIHCLEHYIANKKAYKKIEIPREQRVDYGLCYTCGNEIEDKKYKLCNVCLERIRKNDKSEGLKAINKVWNAYPVFYRKKDGVSNG